MGEYAAIVGLALTALGVILGIHLPTVDADWADETSAEKERRLRIRVGIGIALVLVGTGLQIWGGWPPK